MLLHTADTAHTYAACTNMLARHVRLHNHNWRVRTAALRLHMSDIAALMREGVASGHWPRKRAAAKALEAAVKEAPDAVQPFAAGLLEAFLAVRNVQLHTNPTLYSLQPTKSCLPTHAPDHLSACCVLSSSRMYRRPPRSSRSFRGGCGKARSLCCRPWGPWGGACPRGLRGGRCMQPWSTHCAKPWVWAGC